MFKKLTTLLTAFAVALPISAPMTAAASAQTREERQRLGEAMETGGTDEVLAAYEPFFNRGLPPSIIADALLYPLLLSDREDRLELATHLIRERRIRADSGRDRDGMSALDYAARHGDLHLMHLLIHGGGAVGQRSPHHGAHVPFGAIAETARTGAPEEMRKWYYVMRFGNEEEGTRLMNGADRDGNTLLHHAAIRGGEDGREIAELVLREGADPAAHNNEGKTAPELADAIVMDAMRGLVPDEFFPLTRMIQGGFPLEVLQDRLSGGSSAHPADADDEATPLHYAVSTKRRDGREMEVFLLVLGAVGDVNVRDANGETPLLWAGRGGNVEMIRALIAEGADLGARNNSGQALWEVPSPLSRVARQILADGDANKVVEPHCQYTRLHRAAEEGDVDRVRLLIELGADLEPKSTPGCRGNTPLFQTAMLRHIARVDAAKALIAGGADVNARNAYDETPLHAAAQQAHPELVALFLSEGADPEARWARGETPMEVRPDDYPPERVAAVAEVFASFLGTGALPPPDSGGGNSSAAVSGGNNAASLGDLAGGVSGGLSAEPAPAQNPVDAVIEAVVGGDANDLLDALREADAGLLRDFRDPQEGNSVLHFVGFCVLNRGRDCTPKTDILTQETRMDVDARNNEGETALHIAMRADALDVVRALLLNGEADPDIPNRDGELVYDFLRRKADSNYQLEGSMAHDLLSRFPPPGGDDGTSSQGEPDFNPDGEEWRNPGWREPGEGGTGLHFAAREGTLEQLRELLGNPEWAGLIDAPDNFGMTPLMTAAWMNRLEHFDILKEAGARFDGVNGGGYMIIHIASERGNLEMLREALDAGQDPNIPHGEGLLPSTLGLNSPDPVGVLRVLMDSGRLDLHARNAHGTTVVHDVAASSGDIEMLHMLAEAGADFASEGFGRTPLQWAEFREHHEAAEFIREHLAGL